MTFKTAHFLSVMFVLFATPCFAVLGENESSVELDRQDMGNARHERFAAPAASKANVYSVHQLISNNTTVLEYADLEGRIFAITWSGQNIPVLSGLLGKYAGDFEKGLKKQRSQYGARNAKPRLSQNRIEAGQITVENSGHMGAQTGRAYIPTMLPINMTLAEIK